jgi:hypothetical protein
MQKILQLETKFNVFDIKISIFLCLYEGLSSYSRSLQPLKENFYDFTLKNVKFLTFFVSNFCLPGSGSPDPTESVSETPEVILRIACLSSFYRTGSGSRRVKSMQWDIHRHSAQLYKIYNKRSRHPLEGCMHWLIFSLLIDSYVFCVKARGLEATGIDWFCPYWSIVACVWRRGAWRLQAQKYLYI